MIATQTPDFSIFNLTQEVDSPPPILNINTGMLEATVGSLLEVLIQQQIASRIWVKLPQSQAWLPAIQRYHQEERAERIIWCNPPLDWREGGSSDPKIVPISLTSNESETIESRTNLKKESFLLVLSREISVLIVAKWQKPKPQTQQKTVRRQPPQLRMVCSFEPTILRQVLAGLKTVFLNPENAKRLSERDFELETESTPSSQLLTALFLKQIQQTTAIQLTETNTTPINAVRDAVRHKDELLTGLVRELRPPLTYMKTALSLLNSKQLKLEQRQRYLDVLQEQCDRQNAIFSRLLELMQLEQHSDADFNFVSSLEDIVPGVVSTYQPLAEEKGIQLGYTIPPKLPPISCPPNWLRQISIDLLNNSLQYTPSNGRISIQVNWRNEHIELNAIDTGMGIEASDLPKICQSFYRGRNAYNEYSLGAGLGLTIVQQLVKRCGGTISISSKQGKGTSVKVLLPIVVAEIIEE
jgi:two-component system, OmpR family, phosphate regulon sensor histidine kinase PhoR